MENALGLRRGAWTYEEDKLLKACINNYGEGKWHLVSARAGLNRCRKSCRLRWLNYLNPNIKRGSFTEDEVDLILRMHKLVGNRWSLIAGRIPGRTANDVKNYWHTHLLKKVVSDSNKFEENKEEVQPKETKQAHHEIIKPRPRTLSASSSRLKGKATSDVSVRECATPPLVASNEDVNVLQKECDIETMLPFGGDGDSTAQACPLSEMWWEDLWNMEEDQVGNEKIGSNYSLTREQDENSHLEFPKEFLSSTEVPTSSDIFWDF